MRGRDAPCAAIATALIALAAAPAAPAGAVASCPHRDDPAAALSLQARRAALLCQLGTERAARGLPPVRQSGQLSRGAQRYAADMVARKFFAHVSPDGATLTDRVRATGYLRGRPEWALGEAIAWAQQPLDSAANLVSAWLNSPPHRAILLGRRYRDVGIGVALGLTQESTLPGATAVLDFGFRSRAGVARGHVADARRARASR